MMRALLVLALLVGVASAQPSTAPSTDPAIALREANAAATAGDWARVSASWSRCSRVSSSARISPRRTGSPASRRCSRNRPSYTAADGHFLAYLASISTRSSIPRCIRRRSSRSSPTCARAIGRARAASEDAKRYAVLAAAAGRAVPERRQRRASSSAACSARSRSRTSRPTSCCARGASSRRARSARRSDATAATSRDRIQQRCADAACAQYRGRCRAHRHLRVWRVRRCPRLSSRRTRALARAVRQLNKRRRGCSACS